MGCEYCLWVIYSTLFNVFSFKPTLIRTLNTLSLHSKTPNQHNGFCLGDKTLKLSLLITKKEIVHYNTRTKTKYLFSVIDLDKSKKYPQNFVSVLPRNINAIVKPSNIFEELFGNQSLETAKQLLEKALKTRPDTETTLAIRERLKLLNPKLNKHTKCQSCGKNIIQRRKKIKPYKFCFECYSQRFSKSK